VAGDMQVLGGFRHAPLSLNDSLMSKNDLPLPCQSDTLQAWKLKEQ
jgi:hypothetical protein